MTLYRYRADAQPPLVALASSVNGVSLATTNGGVFALVDGGQTLARVDGDDLTVLRVGVVADLGSDFAIHDGVLYVATAADVRASSSTGGDAPLTFTSKCEGFTDVVVCGGVLYCSSPSRGELMAVDLGGIDATSPSAGDERARIVGTFDVDNDAPALLCHDDALFVQDLGRLSVVVPGGALTELARFPAAGSNFGNTLSVDHGDPRHLFLTQGIGAAGPYAYLYELASGRLTPVARGHALAIDDGVALTDDYNFVGGIARVSLTRP